MIHTSDETICALATPPGSSAIAVIRVSGRDTFSICGRTFTARNSDFDISRADSHTIHLGMIRDGKELIDEVLLSVFRNPNSYTGEDAVEISCHGSDYIQQKIINLLIREGARMAQPGEFTLRAFLNGKFDLSQAEAVADLIAASSKTAHDLALNQMRGGFSKKIKEMRQKLVDFTSLIELELDFSEEDVQFADRSQLKSLLSDLSIEISKLIKSFSLGNVLKKGIPVAIVGKPNVGKSTLLNAILNEEKAIVSEIPGTTRDAIEDTIIIEHHAFRFVDTAGLRHSTDKIETIGIEKTYQKIDQSKVILYVFDVSATTYEEIVETMADFRQHLGQRSAVSGRQELTGYKEGEKKFILIGNKTDLMEESPHHLGKMLDLDCVFVSAKRKENIHLIADKLLEAIKDFHITDSSVISNVRHYEALSKTLESINSVMKGLEERLSGDLLTVDIHTALHHLGSITGEVTTDEILGNIFGKFCIGK